MRAGLAKKEPEILARWAALDLYKALRKQSDGREKFILHDGPPYANGSLHMGHALNRILKDMITRSHQMLGRDSNYVPGWDCHGLPIEWKVEEKYRASGKDKDQVPVIEFRQECRAFAEHWIDEQRKDSIRLGIIGDWENPYLTMSFDAEAQIVREFQKFVMNGGLYRGSKPVMWSVVEKTALAEAEVEYKDHVSPAIWVKFPVAKGGDMLGDASVVIWTTTPWTIPGNRAISYSPRISYAVYEVTDPGEAHWAAKGERLIVAEALADDVKAAARIGAWVREDAVSPEGFVCRHPFAGQGYDFDVPLLAGDHVTDEAGTGFVHTAPGHGAEDYDVWMQYADLTGGQAAIPHTVGEDGAYLDNVPLFAGLKILYTEGKKAGKNAEANGAVLDKLIEVGALLAKDKIEHSYPHSWRSKAPVIYRNTPQWFVSMDKVFTGHNATLRETALDALKGVRFVPEKGRNRITSMVEGRPDWVLSRQRAWGVPLTVFVHKETGEILRNEAVNTRIADAVEEKGADVWFEDGAKERFLGPDVDAAQDWEMADDILDVWFDSGSTHAFVLERRPDLRSPADVYLEGSDQHRGWFQSSLLESCGTRGVAPYKAVITHGFLLDDKGMKMSKSGGNQLAPQKVIEQNGADILRLWVASSDYGDDLRIGPEIIKSNVDAYRKLRNTLRFLLGNLAGFSEAERVDDISQMPELERYILHRLWALDKVVRQGFADFDFREIFTHLSNFCNIELSAFYFDIRKDSLYCDKADDLTRRSCRTVLDHLFRAVTLWFAPMLSFTCEEAWLARYPDYEGSVHMELLPDVPDDWHNEDLAAKWDKVRRVRRVVTGALEVERRDKRIGASLEAAPAVYVSDKALLAALDGLDLADICITSGVTVLSEVGPGDAFRLEDVADVAVVPNLADGDKCERCWKVLPEVGSVAADRHVCERCADAIA